VTDRECLIFGGADGVEVPFLPSDSRRRPSYSILAGLDTQNGNITVLLVGKMMIKHEI
jgi:hypothetical protein